MTEDDFQLLARKGFDRSASMPSERQPTRSCGSPTVTPNPGLWPYISLFAYTSLKRVLEAKHAPAVPTSKLRWRDRLTKLFDRLCTLVAAPMQIAGSTTPLWWAVAQLVGGIVGAIVGLFILFLMKEAAVDGYRWWKARKKGETE